MKRLACRRTYGTFSPMKKSPANEQQKQRAWILAGCEENRQRCNKLSDEERKRLREKTLAFIHGHDAKAPAGRR